MSKITGTSDSNFIGEEDSAAYKAQQVLGGGQDLAQILNEGYICPTNSGPYWRAAYEAGVDMALIEDSLRMKPVERLRQHQLALNQILSLTPMTSSDDPGS